mgnify:CR=1 FL=1
MEDLFWKTEAKISSCIMSCITNEQLATCERMIEIFWDIWYDDMLSVLDLDALEEAYSGLRYDMITMRKEITNNE